MKKPHINAIQKDVDTLLIIVFKLSSPQNFITKYTLIVQKIRDLLCVFSLDVYLGLEISL